MSWRSWDSDVDGKKGRSGWSRFGEIGGRKVHTDVGGAFSEVVGCELRSLNGNGVGGVGELSERGKCTEDVGSSVAEGIAEGRFGGVGTNEDVVAIGVERLATVAVGVNESGREEREAKTAEESKTVGAVVKAVVVVLARHTMKGD